MVPDTFSARSAHLTGLKMMPITRAVSFDHLIGQQLHRISNPAHRGECDQALSGAHAPMVWQCSTSISPDEEEAAGLLAPRLGGKIILQNDLEGRTQHHRDGGHPCPGGNRRTHRQILAAAK
jgi:hypothetical protein